MDRKHLAIALSRVPDPPAARSEREQVRTPGELAARFLLAADDEGDLRARRVVDLGAGTGVLAIGAALLGAERAVGLEIEPGLAALATEAATAAGVAERVAFLTGDAAETAPEPILEALGGAADTVVMNPPFGADRVSRARGGDRVFLSLAFRLAPVVYSFHLAATEAFLAAYARDAGFRAERAFHVDYPLPARFAHHRDAVRTVDVGVYRFRRA